MMKKKFNDKKSEADQRTKNNFKRRNMGVDSVFCLHITATSNNSIFTLTNNKGETVFQLSCGRFFSGSKKGLAFTGQMVLAKVGEAIKDNGIHSIEMKIHTTGITPVRDYLSDFASTGINVVRIIDTTSKNHNGPRPPRARKP